ncbi:hypothetical protein [Ensifer canadensis]
MSGPDLKPARDVDAEDRAGVQIIGLDALGTDQGERLAGDPVARLVDG